MEFGWKRIWSLYGWKELFSKRNCLFYFSLITTILFIVVIILSNHETTLTYELIEKVLNLSLSSLPTLLGFNLGAFALVIGFLSNKSLVEALTEKHGPNSPYDIEKISGIFAINIIVQAFSLLLSFLIYFIKEFINKIHLPSFLNSFSGNLIFTSIVNYSMLFILSFCFLYSISLIIQNAINIFDFNQLFTFFTLKKVHDNDTDVDN